jgi:hypothetical protein
LLRAFRSFSTVTPLSRKPFSPREDQMVCHPNPRITESERSF